jgi:hypothetical protein
VELPDHGDLADERPDGHRRERLDDVLRHVSGGRTQAPPTGDTG